jgi:hypothetical protein
LKNCGAQTNIASHMRFAADHSETLEDFFFPQKMAQAAIFTFLSQLFVKWRLCRKARVCGMAF